MQLLFFTLPYRCAKNNWVNITPKLASKNLNEFNRPAALSPSVHHINKLLLPIKKLNAVTFSLNILQVC